MLKVPPIGGDRPGAATPGTTPGRSSRTGAIRAAFDAPWLARHDPAGRRARAAGRSRRDAACSRPLLDKAQAYAMASTLADGLTVDGLAACGGRTGPGGSPTPSGPPSPWPERAAGSPAGRRSGPPASPPGRWSTWSTPSTRCSSAAKVEQDESRRGSTPGPTPPPSPTAVADAPARRRRGPRRRPARPVRQQPQADRPGDAQLPLANDRFPPPCSRPRRQDPL